MVPAVHSKISRRIIYSKFRKGAQQKTRGRSTAPVSGGEHHNTRCSEYNKDTVHDEYGGISRRVILGAVCTTWTQSTTVLEVYRGNARRRYSVVP